MTTVKFLNEDCSVDKKKYSNGRIALQLNSIKTKSPVATATVNIPDVRLEKDEVLIKDWSENKGILQILIDNKVVSPVILRVQTGFVYAAVVKLLI